MDYIENKSEIEIELAQDGRVWTDENAKVVTAIKKGKVYPHGLAVGAEQDEKVTLVIGESVTIPKKIIYQRNDMLQDRRDLIFTSSNPEVVSVDENGKVTAKAVGTAKITIKNRYLQEEKNPETGEITDNSFVLTCTIKVIEQKSITKAKISSIEKQVYTGRALQPKVTVKYAGKVLKQNIDYTVSYKNNKNIGTATVTIKGKGAYKGTVTKKFAITVKKGKNYTVNKVKYKITNAKTNGKGTVSLVGTTNGAKLTNIIIGSEVKIGGKKFKITAIGTRAFKNCTKLKEVVIGKNVTTIGKEAFYGDKKLAKITIKSKVLTGIGKNALKGIKSKAVIDVPSAKVKAYKKLLKSSVGYKKTMTVK